MIKQFVKKKAEEFSQKNMPLYIAESGACGLIITSPKGTRIFQPLDAEITHIVTYAGKKEKLTLIKLDCPLMIGEIVERFEDE